MQDHEYRTEQSSLRTLAPVPLLLDIVRRWYLIIIVTLLVAMGAYMVSDATYKPVYTTNTTFVVSVRDSSSTVYQNLSATTNLATVFTEVLNSSLLRGVILDELHLAGFDGTIVATPMAETNLLTLKVTASDPRTAFLVTQSIIENHELVSAQVLGNTLLEVLQAPVVPAAPSNPQSSLNFAKKAAILAMLAMCGLLGFISYSRDSVLNMEEASQKLDCRCLGEIHHEQKYKTLNAFIRHKKTGILITKPSTSFHFAESFRKLRRRVEQHMHGGKQVLMVTSVLENEGKSTVIVNLALSMAIKGKKVLLIDCDLRKPSCYKLLERPRKTPGTIDVIVGKQTLEEALTQEKSSGLYTLLEHRAVPSSTNLVGSDGMAHLIAQAREEFDLILLDLPPTSVTPDAEILVDHADSILLVVQQNKATAIQINSSISALVQNQNKLMGCILNNVHTTPIPGQGYDQYGKYGSYEKYRQYSRMSSEENAD